MKAWGSAGREAMNSETLKPKGGQYITSQNPVRVLDLGILRVWGFRSLRPWAFGGIGGAWEFRVLGLGV